MYRNESELLGILSEVFKGNIDRKSMSEKAYNKAISNHTFEIRIKETL